MQRSIGTGIEREQFRQGNKWGKDHSKEDDIGGNSNIKQVNVIEAD